MRAVCIWGSIPSFLIEVARISSFHSRVCSSVHINSFLSWPSVFFQYHLLPFLRLDGMMPLCNVLSACCPLGRGVLGHEDGKYTAAPLLGCQRCAGTKPSWLGHRVGMPLSGLGWSRPYFLLIGPSTTRPCTYIYICNSNTIYADIENIQSF